MEGFVSEESEGGCLQLINGAVLGSPIAHSLSPLLHNTAYQLLGIEGSYSSFEVKSGELQDFLESTGMELNCLSLTMPLKEDALKIANVISPIASQIASGNTLTRVDSKWILTSTDVEGFTFALQQHNLDAKGKVLIIGAGATARAVAAACDPISEQIDVINRNPDREPSMLIAAPSGKLSFLPWEPTDQINNYDVVVNTTPGNSASFLTTSLHNPMGAFFEVLYNPWPTELLKAWSTFTSKTIDGLDLLIHQAISQMEIFAGRKVDRNFLASKLREVGEAALA